MYGRIKISRKKQDRFFNIAILILCILIIAYWLLSGIQLQLNSVIIHNNTELVTKDKTKVKVEHINEEGRLYLEDTTIVEDNEVEEYVRTEIGSGTYYLSNGVMSAEITKQDALNMAMKFFALDITVFLIFVLLMVWKSNRELFTVLEILGYGVITELSDVVWKYYCLNILKSGIWVQWIVYGRFILYALACLWMFLHSNRKRKKGVFGK